MSTSPSHAQGHAGSAAPGAHAAAVAAPVLSKRVVGIGAVLALAFVWMFWRWFERQSRISINHMEDWGHALVIPLISVYMLWQAREKIAATPVRVFWPAFVPFLVGILSYVYTVVYVNNHMLQGFSLILTLGSMVLFVTGPAMLRRVFLPIAYLLLMVTVAESIMLAVTFSLQLIASQGSWIMLSLIGEPFGWFSVTLDGNTLEIMAGNGKVHPLNVAEACSGMRMVVAFYALAGAVALLGTTQWWQRIALLLLAGPVAIFMNMIRVTVLGLLTMVDPDLATGDAHTMIGTLLLIPSLALFLGVVWILGRLVGEPDGPTDAAQDGPNNGPGKGAPA